jgi:phosphoribosylanthranilate isomerase
MTKIKICGLFRHEDVEFVNLARPDYVGFVFAENSRRFVARGLAEQLSKKLRSDIVPVGVFVDAKPDDIIYLFKKGIIRAAQLHGNENDIYIAELKRKCGDLTVIKAVSADGISDNGRKDGLKNIDCGADNLSGKIGRGAADFLLVDNGKGGTGKTFDWRKIRGIEPPFFLAGGLDGSNIFDALRLSPYAVDISGGAETNGVKDGEKIMFLTQAARSNRTAETDIKTKND